jgi:hypothetical protein
MLIALRAGSQRTPQYSPRNQFEIKVLKEVQELCWVHEVVLVPSSEIIKISSLQVFKR